MGCRNTRNVQTEDSTVKVKNVPKKKPNISKSSDVKESHQSIEESKMNEASRRESIRKRKKAQENEVRLDVDLDGGKQINDLYTNFVTKILII